MDWRGVRRSSYARWKPGINADLPSMRLFIWNHQVYNVVLEKAPRSPKTGFPNPVQKTVWNFVISFSHIKVGAIIRLFDQGGGGNYSYSTKGGQLFEKLEKQPMMAIFRAEGRNFFSFVVPTMARKPNFPTQQYSTRGGQIIGIIRLDLQSRLFVQPYLAGENKLNVFGNKMLRENALLQGEFALWVVSYLGQ